MYTTPSNGGIFATPGNAGSRLISPKTQLGGTAQFGKLNKFS